MKHKALAIQAIERAPGLGIETVYEGNTLKPNCAIGWLHKVIPEGDRIYGVYDSVQKFFGLNWGYIAKEEEFVRCVVCGEQIFIDWMIPQEWIS